MLVNMRKMLEDARRGGYAVGFFDTVNVETAQAVIETAEELNAPVIIGTAEVLLPYMSLEHTAEFLLPMAQKACVPVAVHYDHGLTFDKCMQAIRLGYSSIMYDCSTAALKESAKSFKFKSRSYTKNGADYAVEFTAKDTQALTARLNEMPDVSRFSVIDYDAEDLM